MCLTSLEGLSSAKEAFLQCSKDIYTCPFINDQYSMCSVFRFMWLLLLSLPMHPVTIELEVSHLILCSEKPMNVSVKIRASSFLLNRYCSAAVVLFT